MARVTAVGLLVCVTLIASACGIEEPPELPPLRGDVPEEGRSAPPPADSDVEEDVGHEVDPEPVDRSRTHTPVEMAEPTITILDQGVEPRRELRLALEAGTEEISTTRLHTIQQVVVDGSPITAETETAYSLDLRSRVLEVGDGWATVEREFHDFALTERGGMSPAEVAQFEEQMEGLMGHSMFVRLDDRGATLVAEVPRDLPTTVMGRPDDMVEEFAPSLPFPVEPVGVGARWQVEHEAIETAVLPMATITEFELVELHDDHVVMRVDVHTTIEARKMQIPDGNVEFLETDVVQRGMITWFFDASGSEGSLRSESITGFIETVGGEQTKTEIRQRIEITTTFEG